MDDSVKPRQRAKWIMAWTMTIVGAAGFTASAIGVLFPHEPRGVLLLSWAAIFEPGIVGLIAADES